MMSANFPLQMITMDNAEEYVDLMFDFCMHTGIQKQMEAFRGNFQGSLAYSLSFFFERVEIKALLWSRIAGNL